MITKTVLEGDRSALAINKSGKPLPALEFEADHPGSKLTKELGKIREHWLTIHYSLL